MSFPNPTRLLVGMHGRFSGRKYQVIGRVVMGVTEDDETYYWNEFQLQADDGTATILVYEETKIGGEWRLFHAFEPEYPVTAQDAATKRVGDRLNLTGTDVRVTRVDISQVYFIEGSTVEELAVGSVANYFNAESGSVMQVVSWTGEQVEYYDGVDISPGLIQSAFNLPIQSPPQSGNRWFSRDDSGEGNNTSTVGITILLAIFIFLVLFSHPSCAYNRPPTRIKHIVAGAAPLTLGSSGLLKGRRYRATNHALVDMDETGISYQCHEYQLTADDGQIALLICGLKPGDKNDTLFLPLNPLIPPTALESAAKKIGDLVNVDGVEGPVRRIFLATVTAVDSDTSPEWHVRDQRFGYLAQSQYAWLLVRWNVSGISFQQGTDISATIVARAFAAP